MFNGVFSVQISMILLVDEKNVVSYFDLFVLENKSLKVDFSEGYKLLTSRNLIKD
jgi:hypothetical protein